MVGPNVHKRKEFNRKYPRDGFLSRGWPAVDIDGHPRWWLCLCESVTIDEVAHIGAASYLQKLDLRLNEEHPPLAKVLAALPLVLRGVHADYSHITWTISEKFFHAYAGQWVFGERP